MEAVVVELLVEVMAATVLVHLVADNQNPLFLPPFSADFGKKRLQCLRILIIFLPRLVNCKLRFLYQIYCNSSIPTSSPLVPLQHQQKLNAE